MMVRTDRKSLPVLEHLVEIAFPTGHSKSVQSKFVAGAHKSVVPNLLKPWPKDAEKTSNHRELKLTGTR